MPLTLDKLKKLSPQDAQVAILNEFIKCQEDPVYCIENYFAVTEPQTGQRVPFKLYTHQRRAVKAFIDYRYNLTMKTRQMGLTTVSAAFVAWIMATRKNQVILVLANKLKTSRKFLRAVREFLDDARKKAPWLVADYVHNNNGKDSFTLKTGSIITAESNNDSAGRGDTINWLICDEVAAISHMDTIWGSAGNTLIRSKGSCIAISCVTEDTYIFTNKGIKQISEFIPKNIDTNIQMTYTIPRYKVLGSDSFRASNIFHVNGRSETLKIKTSYTNLEGSLEHKLWAYKNEKYDWFKLKELEVGDWVNIHYGMNCWGNNDDVSSFNPKTSNYHKNIFIPKKLTPNICYLLGLYISEGWYRKVDSKRKGSGLGSLHIACGDDISFVFKELGLPFWKERINYSVSSRHLIEFMEYLGFRKTKASGKFIPQRLFEMSKENVAALLSGIFDGDGTSVKKTGNVSVVSTSKLLIEQIRILLLNFGILSHYRMQTKEKSNSYSTDFKFNFDSHILQITTKFAEKFYEQVGFRLERKQKNREKLSAKRTLTHIPSSKLLVDELANLYFGSRYKLQKELGFGIGVDPNSKRISREKVEKIHEIICRYNNSPRLQQIKDEILIPQSLWVPIKSITKGESSTFDFSLPHDEKDHWCHSIVYNGILGHQTPAGQTGWYFHQYTHAATNGWNVIDAHWKEHPDFSKGMYQLVDNKLVFYNIEWPDISHPDDFNKYKTKDTYDFILDGKLRSPWYDVESKRLGPRMTKCELDCSFTGSGGEVIDSEILRDLTIKAKEFPPINLAPGQNPELLKGPWRSYREYRVYNPNHRHILSADVATGDGSDYSAFIVLDCDSMEVVATFKDQLLPDVYAQIIAEVGAKFGNCMVIVENAGGGLTTLLELKKLNYPNIYHHILKKKEPEKNQRRRKLGFWQGAETRNLGGDKLEECIRKHVLKVYAEEIIAELHTWVWDTDGKRRHAMGKHDDLIMSLSMAMFYIYYVLARTETNRLLLNTTFGRESISTIISGDYKEGKAYSITKI